jgi:seryl-tRNA synthetase
MLKKEPLKLNLQFFAEESQSAESSAETKNTGKDSADHMIPKTRFDEVNQRYKEVQSKLDELLAERAAADKKSQEEQGKYQELYEQTSRESTDYKSKFEQFESRTKELEGVINTLLETKLTTIDESFHDLIPDNLTAEQKLSWIDKASTKGLFAATKESEKSLGEQTNPSARQSVNMDSLNSRQLLSMAFSRKK